MELNLYIYPASPTFRPEWSKAADVKELLWTFFDQAANEIYARQSDMPHAIGIASGIQAISCPKCRETLDVWGDDELDSWWYEVQENLFGEDPLSKKITMPCCNATASFDDLSLPESLRFGCFHYEVNGSAYEELSADQLKQVEDALGCSIAYSTSLDT